MAYYLRVLGGRPELWLGDEIAFKQLQPLVLLAYLERQGPQPRLAVANLFWPNLAKDKRLARLSEVLRVTDLEAPGVMLRNQDEIGLAADVSSDAAELIRATDGEEYDLADKLYQGHFLENLEANRRLKLEDAPALYDWLLGEREALIDVRRDAVLRHAEQHAARGLFQVAAERALEAFTMRTEQSLLTPDIYSRIYSLALSQDSARAAQVAGEAYRLFGESLEFVKTVAAARETFKVPGNLPPPPDTLFGREAELAECTAYLRGGGRLLVLTGPPGIGKTRLALELGRYLGSYRPFRDGVYVALLERCSGVDDVRQTLARVVGTEVTVGRDADALLACTIGTRRVLLILDNFETVLDAAALLDYVLETCPQLTVVVTSRTHLLSAWARHHEVEGLAFPQARRVLKLGEALEYPALALLAEQSAQGLISEATLPDLQNLMELLGGLPLALKLAAGWLETVDLSILLEELRKDLGFLSPPEYPQIGVAQAIDFSFRQLEAEDGLALCRLAVMAAPFSAKTSSAVAGASLNTLRVLHRRSLLTWDKDTKRYSFHPLIRQYARQKLAASGEETELRQRHAEHFLTRLDRILVAAPEDREALYKALEPEVRELEGAWHCALAGEQFERLEQLAYPLCMVCHRAAYLTEGLTMIEATLAAFDVKSPMLLATQGWFLQVLGHYAAALSPAQEGLALASQGNHRRAEQLCLETLGASCGSLGRYHESATYFEEVLSIVPGGDISAATTHMNLGISQTAAGRYDEARHNLEQARELFTLLRASPRVISTEFHIGELLMAQNHLEEATLLIRKTLEQASARGMTYRLPQIRLALAQAELQGGQLEAAQDLAAEALEQAQVSGRKLLEGDALLCLASCALQTEAKTSASDYLRQAHATFLDYKDTRRLLRTLLILVTLVQKQNEHATAKTLGSILWFFREFMTAAEQARLSDLELEAHDPASPLLERSSAVDDVVRRALKDTPFATWHDLP